MMVVFYCQRVSCRKTDSPPTAMTLNEGMHFDNPVAEVNNYAYDMGGAAPPDYDAVTEKTGEVGFETKEDLW